MTAGNQVQGESALAHEYFKIYRDMPSDQRSLRALCDYQVFGRKRSQSVFTRWSVKHNWQERVRIWDVQRSREALSEVIIQRNKELIDFINEDFSIAKRAQNIAKQKLTELEGSEELNAHQYRQVMMGYREAREFLKELIGIFENSDSINQIKI